MQTIGGNVPIYRFMPRQTGMKTGSQRLSQMTSIRQNIWWIRLLNTLAQTLIAKILFLPTSHFRRYTFQCKPRRRFETSIYEPTLTAGMRYARRAAKVWLTQVFYPVHCRVYLCPPHQTGKLLRQNSRPSKHEGWRFTPAWSMPWIIISDVWWIISIASVSWITRSSSSCRTMAQKAHWQHGP